MLKSIVFNKFTIAAMATLMLFSFTSCKKDEPVDESKTVHYGETIKDGDIELSYGDDDGSSDTLSEDEQIEINLGILKGSANISFLSLVDRNAAGLTNEKYVTTVEDNSDALAEKLKNGEIDAATLPVDVAAKLYNETNGGIRVVAITALSNVYVVQNGEDVDEVEDLGGKTIYASKENMISAYTLEAVLKSKSVADYKIEYKDTTEELVQAVNDGSVSLALLPQPEVGNLKAANANVTSPIDLSDDWSDLSGSNMVTNVVAISNDFMVNHATAIKYLMSDCQSTINVTNHKIDEISQLAVQEGIFDDAATAKSSIRLCGVSYFDGSKMENMLGTMVNTLAQYNLEAVGNKIPDSGFYYKTATDVEQK